MLLALLFVIPALAVYPDSIEVDVTFYDFHSDGSNPDFNPGADNDSITRGLVNKKLSPEGIPTSRSKCLYSYDIERWFTSNPTGGYKTVPHYGWQGVLDWVDTLNETELRNDSTYKNIVIDTFLTFTHQGNGVYSFESSSFFPLDNKGFGKETTINWDGSIATPHNYSFTMKLERDFIYEKGLSFDFKGDDDVWVFIDGNLALDIGGCHPEREGSFNLDAKAEEFNLIEGNTYTLSFFFAERQADGSNCKITSNIISAPPTNISIKVKPSDTVIAGNTLFLEALIDSDTGLVDNITGSVKWDFIDEYNVNKGHILKSTAPKEATISPTKAHTTLLVSAQYTTEGKTFSDTVTITVIPNRPHHVVIENSGNTPSPGSIRLWENHHYDTILVAKGDEYEENFYAVYRDQYNNWISPISDLNNRSWTTTDTTLAVGSTGSEKSFGEGRVTRNKSIKGGKTILVVKTEEDFADSAIVLLEKMYYIECHVLPNPFSPEEEVEGFPEFPNHKGTIFTFSFIGKSGNFSKATFVRINIFDHIGNHLAHIESTENEIEMRYDVDGTIKGEAIDALALVPWSGRNKNKRTISSGTYVAIVEFEDNGGTKYRQTVPISVSKD